MSELTPNPAFMHRCLELAALGRGRVGNGALVGAVLVRHGKIIGEGFHAAYGEAHAERALLDAFNGQVLPEDVLYVNLEPCCHQGKTPPCTNILIERGVKTIVYGMVDPDPRVTGKGIAHLIQSGVKVVGPFDRELCENLNKGFIQVRKNQRPYITVKKAVSSDGKIANHDGSPMKITSKEQDTWSHRFLRARHDAILVGVGTVITDNPQLNIRFDQTNDISLMEGLNRNIFRSKNSIQPYRVILDPAMKISLDAKVVSDAQASRTILCVTPEAADREQGKVAVLQKRGVRIVRIPLQGDHFDWEALWRALITPVEDYHGLTSILVEGGEKTWEVFKKAGFMNEEVILTGKLFKDLP
ncbi:MAG: bifunctional diaminohydroxyphosphoribosylaminopyrimidine deaminase/5-amino-6-(5-phosphoribosylamino)uracil reductase RibD [Candidatus Peribacteraceae bacterium]|nr:bifunctional diaminohydroxyphosphoribosylaminopyrimidine deaminase/5-amino-6-(5-phosphoribosylamino)uracil reductase RibD [Candidatus Peribacteraceae bacterium]